MPNFGLCADCNSEVELNTNGACSICQSDSTMKRHAVTELELAIEMKHEKACKVIDSIWHMLNPIEPKDMVENVNRFIKALEDYKNV
jgi:Fe-S cluster biogenesis protein NfuA